MVPAVFVYRVNIGWASDIECFHAYGFGKGEVNKAGDEGEYGFWHAGAGLEEAPLRAVLVGPGAPGLAKVVLRIESGVVGVVAAVDVVGAGRDEGYIDPACEVEHCGC